MRKFIDISFKIITMISLISLCCLLYQLNQNVRFVWRKIGQQNQLLEIQNQIMYDATYYDKAIERQIAVIQRQEKEMQERKELVKLLPKAK